MSRLLRMRRGVLTTAAQFEATLQAEAVRYRKAFVTLTYRPGVEWSPRHITALIMCYRAWANRRAIKLRYVWVIENQKRGIPHYHIVFWLPRGVTPPMPDKQGWWRHGSTNTTWARRPVGYLAKYISKGLDEGIPLPAGVRLWGSGGLTEEQRKTRSWRLAPSWLRAKVPEGTPIRRGSHGWYNHDTGELHHSPYHVAGFTPFGPILRRRTEPIDRREQQG